MSTFKLPLHAQGTSKFLMLSSSWQIRHSTIWISGSSSSETPWSPTFSTSVTHFDGSAAWELEPSPANTLCPFSWCDWILSGVIRRSTHKTRWSLIIFWSDKITEHQLALPAIVTVQSFRLHLSQNFIFQTLQSQQILIYRIWRFMSTNIRKFHYFNIIYLKKLNK